MPVIVIPSSTGANTVFVNADTGRNVVLSGIGGQNSVILSGFKETPPHNSLVGLQGGSASQYYHLNSGQYFNLVTGQVVRPSDTGSFYPISNPSGYITGLDLSNYSTIPFSTGISGYLQNQVTNLNNQTGNYYLISNPSGYITGVNLSGYVTGDVIRPSDTGAFYPVSNPSGYITGINNIVYTTGDQSITGVKTFLSPPTISGNQVATVVDPVRTTLTGNGVLSGFAISGAGSLSNPSALIVAIDGALQEPTVDYGVGGGVITFTSPLASGAKAVVISPTNTLQITEMIPADGSVTSAKLANDLEISGIVGFNSTTRPTSDGTGTPTGDSLVTLSDTNTLYDWIPLPPPTAQVSASGGETNVHNFTSSGSTAGGIGTWLWYGSGYRPVWLCLGSQTNSIFNQRIRIAFRLGIDAAAGTGRIRFLTHFPATSLGSTPTIKTIGFEIIGTTLKAAVFGVTYNVDSEAGFTVASNFGGRGYDVVLDYQAPTLNIYVDGSLVSSVSNGPTGATTAAVNQQAIFQSHNADGGAGNACAALMQNVRYKIN